MPAEYRPRLNSEAMEENRDLMLEISPIEIHWDEALGWVEFYHLNLCKSKLVVLREGQNNSSGIKDLLLALVRGSMAWD